jgi:hypothetical protein
MQQQNLPSTDQQIFTKTEPLLIETCRLAAIQEERQQQQQSIHDGSRLFETGRNVRKEEL